ncbi:MAG: protein translocase subunit SecF [Ktedonobacterales bacterium]
MYHLTRYRYYFFALSLAVIVPGLLALIFWHLNLGIDFTNGTTVDLRFQAPYVSSSVIAQAFEKEGAQDVSVYPSVDSDTPKADRFVFIEFNHAIGTDEESAVLARLQDPKYKLPALTVTNGKVTSVYTLYSAGSGNNTTAVMVVLFNSPATASEVGAALQNLPKTDAPPAGSVTSTPTATAAATAKATATATPSTSSSSTASTFPVAVSQVKIGENNSTYEVNTQTDLVTNNSAQLNAILANLSKAYDFVYIQDHSSVGPSIASETTQNAILAVALASLFILIYITIAFRKVGALSLRLRFGASAIIALLHDAFVVLGLWAIFGHFFNFKVDTLFLTAVLTVIGFSVHDTIVVFDRIRENLSRRTSESFGTVVDTSLVQTLSRSLNTSLTVLMVLTAEVLFGGSSIQQFVLALLIGIASGTYSSIFNASMILYVWQTEEYRNWIPWLRGKPVEPQRRIPRPVARVRA